MQLLVLSCKEWNVDLPDVFHGSSLPSVISTPTAQATCPMGPGANPSGLPEELVARPLTRLWRYFSFRNYINSWSSPLICINRFHRSQRCWLTCSHASHVHQPPFWDSWKDHNNSVPLLQSAYFSQHIRHLPREEAQLLKAPLHFFSFSIYPPKGRVWWSLSSLQNTGIQTKNILFWKTVKL